MALAKPELYLYSGARHKVATDVKDVQVLPLRGSRIIMLGVLGGADEAEDLLADVELSMPMARALLNRLSDAIDVIDALDQEGAL